MDSRGCWVASRTQAFSAGTPAASSGGALGHKWEGAQRGRPEQHHGQPQELAQSLCGAWVR